ncbi:FAD-dependent monooxygenase [Nocardia sp. NPDC051832]|uniref:FAD-dependent monooxygenase n=1 Tax=Nocardia sp. NPDC051832 TaxID=3155673 RepID=UPI003438831E
MRNQSVLISGASVAGPALAYWLDRYGFEVTVVERAPELRPGGQAVDFKGATHQTVVERMGIWAEVQQRSTGTTDIVFVDEQGERIGLMSGDFTGGDVEILRGDLAEIMYRRTSGSCEYVFGDSISALTETADGVLVEFERGEPRTFDLVFGADGIHSRVRRLAFGPESEFVEHLGYYYCVVGASPWTEQISRRERQIAYGLNAPGLLAVDGGAKAQQMYVFATPEIEFDRTDIAAQRRIVSEKFAGLGWEVPRMLAEAAECEDFYLDSLSQVRMRETGYTTGRIALVGDSAYGNTLGGFGTGLAVVGAYVVAGELALADGDHTVAFERYTEIMRRYAKIAKNTSAGRFFAPRTGRGIKFRNWFLGSRMFALMTRFGDKAANDIDLKDYPALTTK